MEVIADLQLHSKYSQAVSKYMDLEHMAMWAAKKGIDLITTGDWQHPLWFKEIMNKLEEVSDGIYRLTSSPEAGNRSVSFMLVTEISSIYTQGGKGRRVHNLIFSPSVEICMKVISELTKRKCNLDSDGRPIVGISSKDLLDLLLNIDERILFVPAHIWTPWFGLFGSKSGFDSIKDCFGELEKYIYAVETGLSSDPVMNWGIKELESRSIVSFSDAHSGPKMGREATVFKFSDLKARSSIKSFTYNDVTGAIKKSKNSTLSLAYTVEFFPEEGKYHLSGHRSHGVVYSEEDLRSKGDVCPVCNRTLTLGVEHRICSLSYKIYKNEDIEYRKEKNGLTFIHDNQGKKVPFISLVPLSEILNEVLRSKAKSDRIYNELTSKHTELDLLLRLDVSELENLAGGEVSEAIMKVRDRRVKITPGYDGVYGKVSIL
jgi:PHP family Zn ribbon phosphoesterase